MIARCVCFGALFGFALAFAAGAVGQTTPQTFYVDETNGNAQNGTISAPFRTIGGAMGLVQANRGDTVIVRPGIYAERVTVKEGTLLISEAGATRTIIAGTQSVPADLVTLERASTLRGFSVGETGGAAVRVPVGGSAEITNCVLYASESGLRVEVDALAECVNNTIYNNLTGVSAGQGAQVAPFSNNIVAENTTGVFIGSGASVGATFNGYHNNPTAVSGGFPGNSDFVSNPLFVNAQGLNFHLRDVSNMRDAGDPLAAYNDRDASRNDVGADGGPFGTLDTLAPQIFVTSFPSPAQGEAPLAVLFNARASQDEWGIASWEWDFDASDGISVEGFGASAPVLYDAPGGYLVTLFVTDNSGFRSSSTYTVRVGEPPVVAIESTPKAGPAPLTVNFSADVSSGDGLAFAWDFDSDGVVDEEGASPTFVYPAGTAPGLYSVTLTATDAEGVVTQVQSPITVTEFDVAASANLSAGNLATVRIDDAGSPINGARVTVPLNAVNGPMTVAVSEVTEDDLPLLPTGQIAGLINVSPSGLVFSRAVQVQLPLPVGFTDLTGLRVVYYDPASQAWFDDGISSVRISDTAPRTVSFDASHFTTFAVTVPGGPVAPKQCGCAGGDGPTAGGLAGDALLAGALMMALVVARRRGGARIPLH